MEQLLHTKVLLLIYYIFCFLFHILIMNVITNYFNSKPLAYITLKDMVKTDYAKVYSMFVTILCIAKMIWISELELHFFVNVGIATFAYVSLMSLILLLLVVSLLQFFHVYYTTTEVSDLDDEQLLWIIRITIMSLSIIMTLAIFTLDSSYPLLLKKMNHIESGDANAIEQIVLTTMKLLAILATIVAKTLTYYKKKQLNMVQDPDEGVNYGVLSGIIMSVLVLIGLSSSLILQSSVQNKEQKNIADFLIHLIIFFMAIVLPSGVIYSHRQIMKYVQRKLKQFSFRRRNTVSPA